MPLDAAADDAAENRVDKCSVGHPEGQQMLEIVQTRAGRITPSRRNQILVGSAVLSVGDRCQDVIHLLGIGNVIVEPFAVFARRAKSAPGEIWDRALGAARKRD